jgi:hypothetical protein
MLRYLVVYPRVTVTLEAVVGTPDFDGAPLTVVLAACAVSIICRVIRYHHNRQKVVESEKRRTHIATQYIPHNHDEHHRLSRCDKENPERLRTDRPPEADLVIWIAKPARRVCLIPSGHYLMRLANNTAESPTQIDSKRILGH